MTDIIPLASSGRYMGIANIANSIAGPLGVLVAGPLIMDAFTRSATIRSRAPRGGGHRASSPWRSHRSSSWACTRVESRVRPGAAVSPQQEVDRVIEEPQERGAG